MIIALILTILIASVLAILLYRTKSGSKPTPASIPVSDIGPLIEEISMGIAKGIQASLGLDISGEIIEPEQEPDDGPIAIVHDLEQDPFLREMEQWTEEYGSIGSQSEGDSPGESLPPPV